MSETNAAIDIAAVRARHEALFAPNWGKRALVVMHVAMSHIQADLIVYEIDVIAQSGSL